MSIECVSECLCVFVNRLWCVCVCVYLFFSEYLRVFHTYILTLSKYVFVLRCVRKKFNIFTLPELKMWKVKNHFEICSGEEEIARPDSER